MQLLPAAIEYKYRNGEGSKASTRIVVDSSWLESFLLPYQPHGRSSKWLRPQESESSLEFPLETCLPRDCLRDLGDRFFRSNSRNFFTSVGFPENSRGVFQADLHHQRQHGQRGFHAYYVPNFPETELNQNDHAFWLRLIDWAEIVKLPLLTHVKFYPSCVVFGSMTKTLVETNSQKAGSWEIVTDLLLSRFYIGGYNIISELAMLLNVPCIILLPAGDLKFPLETKWNVQYVSRTSQGYIDFESVQQSFICLERLLVPER